MIALKLLKAAVHSYPKDKAAPKYLATFKEK